MLCDSLKEQILALTVVREPSSRACGCLLRSWDPEAWPPFLHRDVHTTSLPQTGWLHPRFLLKTLLSICCPQNCALGSIWKSISWPVQTHARASSKVNTADDGMPVLNPMPWSDLVCQRNFTDKTVSRGSSGARKPNLNSLSSFREIYAFMTSFTRCTGKPVVNHTKLLLFSVVFMLNKIFFYTRMHSFFFFLVIAIQNHKTSYFYKSNENTPSVCTVTHKSQVAKLIQVSTSHKWLLQVSPDNGVLVSSYWTFFLQYRVVFLRSLLLFRKERMESSVQAYFKYMSKYYDK